MYRIFFVFLLFICAFSLPSIGHAQDKDFWSVRCNDEENLDKRNKRGLCEIYQSLSVRTDEQGNLRRIAEFAIGYPEGRDQARGVLVLPLGIFVNKGLELQVDDNASFKFEVRYCDTSGCVAFLNLSDDVLDMMRKGDKITLRFQSIKPQNIEMGFGLKGFTKALKDVS